MDQEAEESQPVEEKLSYAEQSLLTLEKLSEFKNLFEYYKTNNHASITDMREDIFENFKGYVIKLGEFDTFFKDYEPGQSITEDQFFEIFNFYEQKILEKAAVYENSPEDTVSEIDVEIEETKGHQKETSNQYLDEIIGDEDEDSGDEEKDPEVALQDIID